MTDDDPGHCGICKRRFVEYETEDEDEAVTTCDLCLKEGHSTCAVTHACPCQAQADQAKLRTWELACADGRTDG